MTTTSYRMPSVAQYMEWGYTPIPLRAGTKIPRVKNWTTIAPSVDMFRPSDTIGIRCGDFVHNGYLTPLDLDHKPDQGVNAAQTLKELWEKLPVSAQDKIFICESTGGDGYHIWLKSPKPLAKGQIRSKDGIVLGEVLGTGSQIVAQPKQKWLHGRPDQLTPFTHDEIEQVLKIIGYRQPEQHERHPKPTAGNRPGDDFNTRGNIEPILIKHGWRLLYRHDGVSHWQRPGKEKGTSATFNHVPGMFYVFTSSSDAFEKDRAYQPFSVYAFLECGGNFKAAAARLAAEGFGERRLSAASERQAAWLAVRPTGRPRLYHHRELEALIAKENICGGTDATNEELAAKLNRSTRTIQRLIKTSETEGNVYRRYINGKRWIFLSSWGKENEHGGNVLSGTEYQDGITTDATPAAERRDHRVSDPGACNSRAVETEAGTGSGLDFLPQADLWLGLDKGVTDSSSGIVAELRNDAPGRTAEPGKGASARRSGDNHRVPVGSDTNPALVYREATSTDPSGGVWGGEFVADPDLPVCEQCDLGEVTPDESEVDRCSYCDQAIPLAPLVIQALDIADPAIRRLDRLLPGIVHYVTTNGRPDVSLEHITRAAAHIRKHRQYAARDARFRERARELSWRALERRTGAAGRRAALYEREGKMKHAYVWRHQWDMLGDEVQRRIVGDDLPLFSGSTGSGSRRPGAGSET